MNSFTALGHDERGASTTEYALLLAVFSLALVGVITRLGVGVTEVMAAVTTAPHPATAVAATPAG